MTEPKSTNPLTSSQFIVDRSSGKARTGRLALPGGTVSTPVFMPVGTQAAVKALTPDDLRDIGVEIILANTYHLMLRPGPDLISQFGGVAEFMRWDGPVLTDSGGYQVFSLSERREVSDDGVVFRSHLDGSRHHLTPERSVEIQRALGADITMALDVLVGYGDDEEQQLKAMDLTHRWLDRSIAAFTALIGERAAPRPLLFGIAQGGFDPGRRERSARVVAGSAVDGCAIGGLSVGEPKDVMSEMLQASIAPLPADRPRYLMGVGSPEDLWNAVAEGVDMFDCVLPTRAARHGGLYTPDGRVNVKASRFRGVDAPVDPACDCYTCRTFSAAYLHHLYRAGELLIHRLASIHNLRFVIRQIEGIRNAIEADRFEEARRSFLDRYQPVDEATRLDERRRYRSVVGGQ